MDMIKAHNRKCPRPILIILFILSNYEVKKHEQVAAKVAESFFSVFSAILCSNDLRVAE